MSLISVTRPKTKPFRGGPTVYVLTDLQRQILQGAMLDIYSRVISISVGDDTSVNITYAHKNHPNRTVFIPSDGRGLEPQAIKWLEIGQGR